VIDSHLDSDLSETRTQQNNDDDDSEADEDGVFEVGAAKLWKCFASFRVVLDLDHTRTLLLRWPIFGLFVLASRPDQLHQFVLDEFGALDDVMNIVIPNDE